MGPHSVWTEQVGCVENGLQKRHKWRGTTSGCGYRDQLWVEWVEVRDDLAGAPKTGWLEVSIKVSINLNLNHFLQCSHPCADAPCWALCFLIELASTITAIPMSGVQVEKNSLLTYMNTRNCESISFQNTRIKEHLGQIVDTHYLPFIEWLMNTLKLRNNGSIGDGPTAWQPLGLERVLGSGCCSGACPTSPTHFRFGDVTLWKFDIFLRKIGKSPVSRWFTG